MTTYTDVFGGNAIKPADVSYTSLAIVANTILNWPSTGQSPSTSSIMEISSDAARNITMPDARLVSSGETVSIKNTGAFTLSVKDAAAGAIVSIAAGLMYDVYVKTNTTEAGTWGYLQRGAGSSSVDASALDGNGLEASSGELRTSSRNVSYAISTAISETHRAKVVVWTSGGGTFTLAAAATLGDGWYCFFKNNGSGTLTIARTGTEVFDTVDTTIPMLPGQGLLVSTDGANFNTLPMDEPVTSTFSYAAISVAGTGDYTLSAAEYANSAIKFTGILTGARDIIVPTPSQQWIINNATTGSFDLTVKTAAGTGVVVTQTKSAIVYSDGTNVVAGETDEGAGIATPVAIADGGTGGTTANAALTNLGGTATGISIFGAADAAAVRTTISAVGVSDANVFTAVQTVTSSDAGAGEGLGLILDRNSASPAASDILEPLTFKGRSSTGVSRIYAKIRAVLKTATNAAEDGLLAFRTMLAGTEADRVIIGAGLYTAGATGGDKGANTVNASAYYDDNVLIPTVAATTAEQLTGTSSGVMSTPDSVAALWEAGADITDGAAITIGEGGYFNLITSTTAITSFSITTDKAGRTFRVRFDTARTLTHNATSLIIPGGANVTTAQGDIAFMRSLGSGNVIVEHYSKADGTALVVSGTATDTWVLDQTLAAGTGTTVTSATLAATYKEIWIVVDGVSHDSASSQTIRVAISDDGTTYGTANPLNSSSSALNALDVMAFIKNTGVAATSKLIMSTEGKRAAEATKNGITTRLRFSPSNDNFDAGTFYIYGKTA